MNHQAAFETLSHLLKNRRTIKPALMNGQSIPEEDMKKILSLSDFAPNHGRTEPWRFFVFTGDDRLYFGEQHARMYKEFTAEAEFDQKKYDSLKNNPANASHIVIAAMKRGNNPKIPANEEYASTAAAIQNVLLGAQALGIAAMWNTGGMTHFPPMKDFLGLGEEDEVMALLYFGYTDQAVMEVPRKISLEDKIKYIHP